MDLEGLTLPGESFEPVLHRIEGGTKVELPCQIEKGRPERLWFIPDHAVEPDTIVDLELTFAGRASLDRLLSTVQRARLANQTTASVDQEGITLHRDSRNILRYDCAVQPAPEGVDPLYRRSGFIHPLWSPDGHVLTRIQPSDHYHHYGIWNPWTVTHVDGNEVDFWNLAKGQGTVRFAGILSAVSGPVFGGFKVRQEHVVLGGPGKEKTAIHEVWDVRASPCPVRGRLVWIVDLVTTLKSALNTTIDLPSYRYGGGIGFRATDDWTRENCRVLTSEGKTRQDADGSRARWCDVHGGEGAGAGIVFMSHPANREHPEPMRVWPEDIIKDKGYFFFEFCPIRLKGWALEPGKEYVLRYRMVVYDGVLDSAAVDILWDTYAHPPVVTAKPQ
jgi:hypothetical protein